MASAPRLSSAAELSESCGEPWATPVGAALGGARGVGDREREVVELNSKAPVRNERNKRKKVYR